MELIKKKFNETIFYKKDSQLEYQIEALKKMQNEYPDNNKIKQKLKLCELGLKGEREIEFELKNANIGMYVLHDVNLEIDDMKAQIDYIVITPVYTYFIESKNLIGNITVNDRGEFIREYFYDNKKIKEGIYSPLRQVERHIEIFKKIWKQKHTGIIDKALRYNTLDTWFRPLVVMANPKNILNVKYAPKTMKDKIIKSDSLVNYIKNDIKHTNKEYISNQKTMEENAFNLMQKYNVDINRDYEKEIRKWINEDVKENNLPKNIDAIKQALIEYRAKKSKDKNIPAYYIFNDDELMKLIMNLPKTIDELDQLKILKPVKTRLHGQEIIDIINT